MNLTMRALIAVVATAAIVGLAGAYIGAAALQGDEPSPAADTPSPAATTPAATPSPTATPAPAATTPAGTTASVTSDWKEYTDAELGFTIFTPDGLVRTESVIQLTEIGEIPAIERRQIIFKRDDGQPVVWVSMTPNPAGVPLEEWIRTVPGWPCEPGASPTCDPELVTIAGVEGIRFSINVLGEPIARVYFAGGGTIYSLGGNVLGALGYGAALDEVEFQAIIDGFRFGSTPAGTTASVPSDWKAYTDPVLGFSLRFPPDLTAKDLTTPGNTSGLSERVIDIRSEADPSRGVSISVSSIDADLTPEEWALKYTACLPDTIEETVVEGYPAVSCIANALRAHPSLIIHSLDKVYLIGWRLAPEESDGMLASLRLPRK